MYLPDINVWLAMAFQKHVHHSAAKAWFDGVTDSECTFCRMAQQGFLRLATNPKVFGTDAVSAAEAWELYDTLLADPRVVFADEPVDVESHWRDNSRSLKFTPNAWNDAFLAAFSEAASLELVTFDQGFAKFSRIRCTILS